MAAVLTELNIRRIPIQSEEDIVLVRRMVRESVISLGFGPTDRTKIVTAASELARNVFKYAGKGELHLRSLRQGRSVGLELVFEDSGPGIPDVDLALREGFSTSGGLGMGLPGCRRLMDEMVVESGAAWGTRVQARKWLRGER